MQSKYRTREYAQHYFTVDSHESNFMAAWAAISPKFQGFQEQLGYTKSGINVVYSVIAEIAEAELNYLNKLNFIKDNAMKMYEKSNLATQQTTQTVITNVIKNLIESLVSRSNMQKKFCDVLDVGVRQEVKTTRNTLDKSINNLDVRINDVKKGLKDVRKAHQKAKKDYQTAKAKDESTLKDEGTLKRYLSKGGRSEEAKKERQRDLMSKHVEWQKQTHVYNSMQKHLQESTLLSIVNEQETAFKVSLISNLYYWYNVDTLGGDWSFA